MSADEVNSVANEIRLEEYRSLRQELELNRKYVFERPLLIVGATFAGALGLSADKFLVTLPTSFLAVLLFNLWFTANRLRSSGRIVGYLQLVHEGEHPMGWIGWESALQRYREADYERKRNRGDADDSEPLQYHSMAYYPTIFYFHILLGILVTIMIISRLERLECVVRLLLSGSLTAETIWLAIDGFAVVVFALAAMFWFRPTTLRHDIERQRRIWKKILAADWKPSLPRPDMRSDGRIERVFRWIRRLLVPRAANRTGTTGGSSQGSRPG
jgi:hypothetical protein